MDERVQIRKDIAGLQGDFEQAMQRGDVERAAAITSRMNELSIRHSDLSRVEYERIARALLSLETKRSEV